MASRVLRIPFRRMTTGVVPVSSEAAVLSMMPQAVPTNSTQLGFGELWAPGMSQEALLVLNRNKRKLKKANHGARPCNSVGRKSRRPKQKIRRK